MDVQPIRQPPLGERLVAQLRAMIVRGEVAAGTHLVEGWVAERFGVSRGPVRDALRQLEIEGLVEPRSRGVFVRGLSPADLAELYALRGALEGLAIRQSIARLPAGDWAATEAAVTAMRAAADTEDAQAFAAADLDFHSGFYAIAGNRRLTAAWATYRPLFAAVLAATNTRYRDLRPVAQDHADLARIARSGDEVAALAALQRHLDGSCARMSGILHEESRAS